VPTAVSRAPPVARAIGRSPIPPAAALTGAAVDLVVHVGSPTVQHHVGSDRDRPAPLGRALDEDRTDLHVPAVERHPPPPRDGGVRTRHLHHPRVDAQPADPARQSVRSVEATLKRRPVDACAGRVRQDAGTDPRGRTGRGGQRAQCREERAEPPSCARFTPGGRTWLATCRHRGIRSPLPSTVGRARPDVTTARTAQRFAGSADRTGGV
jgi:hypothetical protein